MTLGLPEAERAEFLDSECKSDEALKAEVQSLLAHATEAPTASALKEPITFQTDPLLGKKIGRYHIKHVIGTGGMGTVYQAMQQQPRRVVALKVMKRGIASRSALRRFEYEAQILARLRHPGIAQIYEAGVHEEVGESVPFFAMEYIPAAMPITRYAEQKKLGTRERLDLFARVCDAVQHGHGKGIIHRDLKPSNILVDSSGQPKIIDFGVARSTDSDLAVTTLQTDIGQLIGTLQYMSPEQCLADPIDLDTRSDVYALGVVLYELLCGKVPYDVSRAAVFEATRVIQEATPAKPSTLNKTLRGDVETVVMKALEKDRERRYRSAAEFGEDLRRYLNDEPVTAQPPSLSYQVRMFARKNKVVFRAGVAVIVTLLLGLAGTSLATAWALREVARADRQSELARDAADEADRARRLSERHLAETAFALSTFRQWVELQRYSEDKTPIVRFFESIATLQEAQGCLQAEELDRAHDLLTAILASTGSDSVYQIEVDRLIRPIARRQLLKCLLLQGKPDAALPIALDAYRDLLDERGASDQDVVELRHLIANTYHDLSNENEYKRWQDSTLAVPIGLAAVPYLLLGPGPDGQLLMRDGAVLQWVPSSGQPTLGVPDVFSNAATHGQLCVIATDPVHNRLAYYRRDGVLELRDGQTGNLLASSDIGIWHLVRLAFSPAGDYLVLLSCPDYESEDTTQLADKWMNTATTDVVPDADDPHSTLTVYAIPDLTVSSTRRFWPVSSRAWKMLDWQASLIAAGSIWAFNAERDRNDRGIVLLDSQSLDTKRIVFANQALSFALSPDASVLAVGNHPTNTLTVFSCRSGETLASLEEHENWVTALAFSPDGKWLASGSGDGRVILWHADSWVLAGSRRTYANDYVNWITFDRTGSALGVQRESGAQIWDLQTFPNN